MDQKRLFLAIAISLAILFGFRLILPSRPTPHPAAQPTQSTPAAQTPLAPTGNPAAPGTEPMAVAPPREVPRLQVEAPRVEGSISLVGARFDDLVLRDYHEEVSKQSPLVRLLEPRSDPQPYYAQFGWAADDKAVAVPGDDTLWTASDGPLTATHPVTLSWDNGSGLTFQLVVRVDADYMFTVEQRVQNAGSAPVSLHPWARIRRDYTPVTAGYYILHEGLVGVLDGTLHDVTYAKAKSEGKDRGGVAYDETSPGGWAGITDKYWLTALIPDQAAPETASYRHIVQDGSDRYQVDFLAHDAQAVQPGAAAASTTHLFAGAKEVHLLDRYEASLGIPSFWKAVDFGWFFFLTRPIFYALDWLYGIVGNFGVAILVFTLFVKALFFPLANKSYGSMSKMKLLGPKIQEMRERFKDDPARQQQEMMALYKIEKVNPASGCLPMLLQVPVFFSLYKVIFTTIEMRHAPFFGWIHDLSVVDPTNIFTLFGAIPWDPTRISPLLHLGIWPLIMGLTMFAQQKVNPPPPDPVQARLFQFMPVVFTFMMGRFPAGLVIYWSWNNTLTVLQQWFIMRRTRVAQRATPVRT
jgi:YidC/Oxa1 family membrane protein insertase